MPVRFAIIVAHAVVAAAAGSALLATAGSHLPQALLGLGALALAPWIVASTVRTRAAEKAVRAESKRVKIELLSNVSHELRTPLNAILGYAEIMDTMALSEGERRQMVTRILSNGIGLTCAVNNLLEYSSVVAGEATVRRTPVALSELFEEIEPLVGHLIDEKPVAFFWTVDPALPPLDTDRGKLRQAVLNLLANAAKFTPCGEIRLSAATGAEAGAIEIAVADTGVGMTAGEQADIFEDFRQVEGSASRPFGGMGLGLTLARRHCELLGGSIAIESAPQRGTRVALCFPAATVPGRPGATPAARAGIRKGGMWTPAAA